MKEYRILASFNGSIYGDRSYKRKIFQTKEEAEKYLPDAKLYYSRFSDLKSVEIQSREVSDWTVEKGD